MKKLIFLGLGLLFLLGTTKAEETVEDDLGASREGSRTDDQAVEREENAIKLDGLNVAQLKELREKAEKFAFQAEVNRMMKLIINSLYRNKEIFLRELISNASDALDKIRLLSLTDPSALSTTEELSIKIKADKEGKVLHIIDTGIGMTKNDLINNLGTIAKSGTAEFLSKLQDEGTSAQDTMDMIGQFGVGFYSSFLVADRVIVTTKHNDDVQLIWESDAGSFSITEDPRGNTLKRGTQISLFLKDEATDYLEVGTLRNLVKKYSQFINFPIFLWADKTITVEEPIDETEEEDKSKKDDAEEDVGVEEEKEEKPKTKSVQKTVWEWERLNDHKPIWTRKPSDVAEEEYDEFYKALTKDKSKPFAHVHFVAEGEVSFKSLLYVPETQPADSFNRYGTVSDNIKLYVRRVFITDEFTDLLPKYLAFLQGIVDSDDLPLNVSRETLQQHKLLKVIKKKLIRKALDMFKKLGPEDAKKFWKEYSTNIKLGIIEDPANRSRLAKLLRFGSSADPKEMTTLADYVSRMKPKQEHIYYMAGSSRTEVESSPFVERLLKKGYEVLFLVEAVDEYTIAALPEFEGKKFQNLAKEGFTLPGDSKYLEMAKEKFEPLMKWLSENALKDKISKATISERLTDSPCALIAPMFGWSGNMERLAISNAHQKADGVERSYYLNQRKALEVNPRHPVMRHLLTRVLDDPEDAKAKDIAVMLFRTATLRSGYMLQETAEFAKGVESMLRQSLGISADEPVEEEEEEDETNDMNQDENETFADEDAESKDEDHDEL
ncbi:endoplasmin [Halyomorpha halys]|uniref:endoplasmin n=1 Tax=Halyomorpha halys TaxID=286706 RepID=UPI0006D4CE7E|nr:endoplasmin [Halyomorpha halys]